VNFPKLMHAMRIAAPGQHPRPETLRIRALHEHEVLLKVAACGVCRTDLHILQGELTSAHYPITPGHEIVGHVVRTGPGPTLWSVGARVGVPWLARTCGQCPYCQQNLENLCENAEFTGCTLDGGYADYAIADGRYCFAIPARYSDALAAPLLCAGLIGYRAYRLAGSAARLGLYGFGAAAHLLAQIAHAQRRRVFAFTRPADFESQKFARDVGVVWTGSSEEESPELLDAAIIFAPEGGLVPRALAAVRRGGKVVCAGIHMSDIPSFPYSLLWEERALCSVANLTRTDGLEFMRIAADVELHPSVETFPLEEAPAALDALSQGRLRGAAVLVPSA
jgi:propanol-preferring alcohol dehydrogenase